MNKLKQNTMQIYVLCKELLNAYGDDETELDEMEGVNDVIDEAANFVNAFKNSVLFDEIADIRQVAYEKYQHDWMISHGVGEKAINHAVQEYVSATTEDGDSETAFSDWLFDTGFSGSLWVCYDEFLGAEYQDREYMEYLLSEDEYRKYLADVSNAKVCSKR